MTQLHLKKQANEHEAGAKWRSELMGHHASVTLQILSLVLLLDHLKF